MEVELMVTKHDNQPTTTTDNLMNIEQSASGRVLQKPGPNVQARSLGGGKEVFGLAEGGGTLLGGGA